MAYGLQSLAKANAKINRPMSGRTALLSLLLASLICAGSCHPNRSRELVSDVQTPGALAGFVAIARQNQPIDLDALAAELGTSQAHWGSVVATYARNQQRPLWFDAGFPRRQIQGLNAAVQDLRADGLDPRHYDGQQVAKIALRSATHAIAWTDEEIAIADVQLTLAALKLVRDLQMGAATPDKADRLWAHNDAIDYGALIYLSARAEQVAPVLRSLEPQHPQYRRLRDTLARYRVLADTQKWPAVAEDAHVKPGQSGPQIPGVRERLLASGHLAHSNGSELLDDELIAAIQIFQREHGLSDDGVPGKDTLSAMNISIAERVRQLEINLERWRWLPEDLGDTHVLVNVPTYQLSAVENRRLVLQMRVVAGSARTPTPIFHSAMQSVVFSPYWNIPRSILRGEIRPALAKDPGYLERKNMEVLRNGQAVDLAEVDFSDPSVRVRQRPGAANSLGYVKFLFPNDFHVYLHDTPADALFDRMARNLSHGCVRLEKPVELARWVLRNQPEWTDEKIQSAMDSGREKHVRLDKTIPIYIVYQTVWIADDGMVLFAKDVYGHDLRQTQVYAKHFTSAAPESASTVNL